LLHLHWADLLGTFHSSVPLFDFEISIDGFVVHEYGLKDFSGRVELLDGEKTLTNDVYNVIQLFLGIVKSQVKSIVPNFFELILVLEVALSDLKISINGLGVFSLLFPDLA